MMKEIVQLSLTEEESVILQSLVFVGLTTAKNVTNVTVREREIHALKCFMKTWPEATATLSKKMIALNEATMKYAKEESEGTVK